VSATISLPNNFRALATKTSDSTVELLLAGNSMPWLVDVVFLGAACQFPALHQIEAECRRGVLARQIGSLSEDCLGYAMLHQDPASLFALGCDLARRFKRNGLMRSEWARGRIVAAADGMEIWC
jgi:hypothetical protein